MDFETTGLDSEHDDIITIGTVPFNLNRIFINQAHHWTVRPRQQLAEESVIIHGITHSDILDAPDLSEVYDQVLQQMAGKIMVVHYQRIEREFFDRALKDRINEGIEFFSKKYKAQKYLAYFQAFTNTYAPLVDLKKMYEEALDHEDVIGLVIATCHLKPHSR